MNVSVYSGEYVCVLTCVCVCILVELKSRHGRGGMTCVIVHHKMLVQHLFFHTHSRTSAVYRLP